MKLICAFRIKFCITRFCLQIVLQMENLQAASKQDRSTGIVTPASTVSAFSSTKGTPVNLASSIQAPSKLSDGIVGKTSVQELVVLPISAVEAGLLPSKQGSHKLERVVHQTLASAMLLIIPCYYNTFHRSIHCSCLFHYFRNIDN